MQSPSAPPAVRPRSGRRGGEETGGGGGLAVRGFEDAARGKVSVGRVFLGDGIEGGGGAGQMPGLGLVVDQMIL